MSFWSTIGGAIFSQEFVRAILLLAVGGGIPATYKILKNQRLAREEADKVAREKKDADQKEAQRAADVREKLIMDNRVFEAAIKHLGDSFQDYKRTTTEHFDRLAEERREIKEEIRDMSIKIRGIDSELKPNHGSSLRDAINRVDANAELNKEHLESLKERFEDHLEVANYQIRRVDEMAKRPMPGLGR